MERRETVIQHDGTASTPPSTPPTPNIVQLADIFSDSPTNSPLPYSTTTEPSDIPRLRSTHSTAGYRAGISASKTTSLQPGFDEGYTLGARFGLRVGYLLGVLEALYVLLQNDLHRGKDRVGALLTRSRKELVLENLFDKDWWGEDGAWKYILFSEDGKELDEQGDVTLEQVVKCHPLVIRWSKIVDKEMQNACIEKAKFEGVEWESGRIENNESDPLEVTI